MCCLFNLPKKSLSEFWVSIQNRKSRKLCIHFTFRCNHSSRNLIIFRPLVVIFTYASFNQNRQIAFGFLSGINILILFYCVNHSPAQIYFKLFRIFRKYFFRKSPSLIKHTTKYSVSRLTQAIYFLNFFFSTSGLT